MQTQPVPPGVVRHAHSGSVSTAETPFASLYGSLSPLEDYAELIAFYHHAKHNHDKYEIIVSKGERVVFSWKPFESEKVLVQCKHIEKLSPAQVSVVHEGPELVTFRVSVTLNVPARYDNAGECPSDERVPLVIASQISLRRSARVVDIETRIENTAADHRLRFLLPTDCAGAKTYLAHHPFDFVERAIRVDAATSNWQEMEQAEKPFLGMQSVSEGKRGLAFLSAGGLLEGGIADDRRRTMHITLLRSFRKTVSTGGESDGLELGTIVHRYALMPFGGALPRAEAMRQLARIQAGIISRQTGSRPSGYPALTGQKPSTQSFIELKAGWLVVSSMKPAEQGGGLVIRLWNPTGNRQADTISLWRKVKAAGYTDLSEKPAKGVRVPRVAGKESFIIADPHQIVTVKMEL